MFGILNIDKPSGVTSRDAVNRVQRLTGRKTKVGHAGTLDPLASGVLVVCIGPATRLIEYVQRMRKRYHGTFLLGRSSETEDIEGEVTVERDARVPTLAEIQDVLPGFIGRIEQRPPAYSALKVAGRRAYDLARAGKQIELEARTIEVHDLRVAAYEYPQLELQIECGSGTYVRSLGRDVAASLNTVAVMSALRRTAIGNFTLKEACALDELTAENFEQHLLPATAAVADLPAVTLTDDELRDISHGLPIKNRFQQQHPEIAAVDRTNRLRAILRPAQVDMLTPSRNFPEVGK